VVKQETTVKKKCSVVGCKYPLRSKGFCHNHYLKHMCDIDPEFREKHNKKQLENYYKSHEDRKAKKRVWGKAQRIELYKKLGAKCVSCGEKFDESLERSNLEIHHKFYDEDDLRLREKFNGGIGDKPLWEIRRMLKNGVNPKKKFTLLCQVCNNVEGWVRVNPFKAFEAFAWLYGEGHFDEVLKDNKSLKKLTDFMKK